MATHTRLAFRESISIAFTGRFGRPADTSVQFVPALSERKTRPPPIVEHVTQIRFRFGALTRMSLTLAPERGVVSAVSAPHAVPDQFVR